jgi:hypothetical protein
LQKTQSKNKIWQTILSKKKIKISQA